MKQESKTWSLQEDKISEAQNLREIFGWKFLTKTPFSLTMKRDITPNNKKLSRLEKQYDALNRKFPFSFIPWTIITLIFLILACAYSTKITIGFIFIIGLAISGAIDLTVLLTFLITLPYRKKLKEKIIIQADEYNGNIKTVPFAVNLKQGERNSYQIKKAVYAGEIKMD